MNFIYHLMRRDGKTDACHEPLTSRAEIKFWLSLPLCGYTIKMENAA